MMAAPITVTGATLEPGAPVVLFPTRIDGGGVDAQQGRQYDVAPDGRFLINTVLDERRRADHGGHLLLLVHGDRRHRFTRRIDTLCRCRHRLAIW